MRSQSLEPRHHTPRWLFTHVLCALRYIYRAPPRSSGAGNAVSDPAGPVSPHVSGPERTPAAGARVDPADAPGSALVSGSKRARASTAESGGEDLNTVLRRSLKVGLYGCLGLFNGR